LYAGTTSTVARGIRRQRSKAAGAAASGVCAQQRNAAERTALQLARCSGVRLSVRQQRARGNSARRHGTTTGAQK
jgi:hypothetical protein